MKPSRYPLLIIASGLLALSGAAAELRILAHVGDRLLPVTGVVDNRIVATDGTAVVPLTRDATFELEGDLRTATGALLSAKYGVAMADVAKRALPPGTYAVGTLSVTHLAEISGRKHASDFRATWPTETGDPGLVVMAWVLGGKISQVAVAKIPGTRAAKFFTVHHNFMLTSEGTAGHGMMFLWQQGKFVPAQPAFTDARAQRVFLPMMLGDSEPLRAALAGGMKPDVRGTNGITLLYSAAGTGLMEAMELLIQAGAKTGAATDSGNTPLHTAADRGRLAAVERLLAAKAGVGVRSEANNTALHGALQGGHRAIAATLVRHGADVNVANSDHETPYTLAIDQGYADLATLMLDHVDHHGYDAKQMERVLQTQAAKGNTDMVRFLLGQKFSPRVEFDGTSALDAAAQGGGPELVDVLVHGGAEVNRAGSDGRTALVTACEAGRVDFVRALLDAGADINQRTKSGRTCLSAAAMTNRPELVELLLARGADLAVRDSSRHSPLDLALIVGARETARILAARGATVDLKSPDVARLLESALAMDLASVIRAALAAGWSPDTKFQQVWPALAVARACAANDCVTLLEQAGADRTLAGAPVMAGARQIDAAPRLMAGTAAADPRNPDGDFSATLINVDVVLGPDGRVQFPVIDGPVADWTLGYAALQAAATWRFGPITMAGKPAGVRVTLPLEFPASRDRALKPEDADALPVPISQVAPVYPSSQSSNGQVGRVNVTFTVAPDGTVRNARVRLSSNPAFGQPAIDAVLKWKFRPGLLDGKPVPIRFEQEIVFDLN